MDLNSDLFFGGEVVGSASLFVNPGSNILLTLATLTRFRLGLELTFEFRTFFFIFLKLVGVLGACHLSTLRVHLFDLSLYLGCRCRSSIGYWQFF